MKYGSVAVNQVQAYQMIFIHTSRSLVSKRAHFSTGSLELPLSQVLSDV